MKVLVIGTDRSIFEDGSQARQRVIDQGALFEELHVVIFAKRSANFRRERISQNTWIYPTNSSNKFRYIFDAAALGKKICREKFFIKGRDIISVQDPFECGWAGRSISSATSLPFQIQIHTDFLSPHFRKFSLLNRLRYFVAKRIIPNASCVRVVSKRIADSIQKSAIKLRRPADILPVFVDLERLEPKGDIFDLHRKYPQFDFIMLCVGRLSKEKNFSLAIEVLGAILKDRPNTGLFLVGDGPEKDRLTALARRIGLENKVVFIPKQSDLYYYYKSADVFLLPSVYEGYGLVLVEAAMTGCPIVSADVGIAKEIIPEEFQQFICPVEDKKCFTEKAIKLVVDYGERERYAAILLKTASCAGIFDKRAYLGKYLSILEAGL